MADQRILYTEEMVGANHPSKSDSLNRLTLQYHNTDGWPKAVDSDVVGATVTNTTTETDLYRFTVPANTLSTDRGLRLVLIGDHLNDTAGAVTTTFRVKYGATTIFAVSISQTPSANNRALKIVAELRAANATNAQVASTVLFNGAAGTHTGQAAAATPFYANHNSIAEDSTAAKDLAVTAQHATASASITSRSFTIHLEPIG